MNSVAANEKITYAISAITPSFGTARSNPPTPQQDQIRKASLPAGSGGQNQKTDEANADRDEAL